MILKLKIDTSTEESKALIKYLKTLDFIEFTESNEDISKNKSQINEPMEVYESRSRVSNDIFAEHSNEIKLSEEQKKTIDLGLESLKKSSIPHNTVMSETKKRYPNLFK